MRYENGDMLTLRLIIPNYHGIRHYMYEAYYADIFRANVDMCLLACFMVISSRQSLMFGSQVDIQY